VLQAASADEIDAAFESLKRQMIGGVVISTDPFLESRRGQIVGLAVHHTIPAVYGFREIAASGGLISYGPSLTGVYRQLGIYAGRILQGEKASDLPVQQPTTFELVINLNTAKALGLTVPPSILARADEVIE
jgi:putative ABC transport system substrate-binding protein